MSTESDCVSFMQYENLFSFLVNFQVFVSPIFLLVFHSNSHLKIESLPNPDYFIDHEFVCEINPMH